MTRPVNEAERSRLGLDTPISRRDFLNGSLAGAGSALALSANSATADTFTGYGGVGDYSLANGNTWPVVQAAHRLRDGGYSEAVIGAARDAYAHDFIQARSTGYGTIVGEQGIKLSGGERQRVAIARALVKDAKILVLDEATSSLDSESEHLIQEGLWTLMQGRTVIAIAHRLSTIAGMDRIVYLEAGRIVEEGPHRELLAKGGAYARLWNRQMGGFIDAA